MRKIDNTDRVLAVLGIVVTTLAFLVQGPYDKVWKYLIPAAPIVLVVLIVAVRHLPQYTQLISVALRYAGRAYKQVAGQKLESTLLAHVCDDTGRVIYKRWYRVEVTRPGLEVTATKKELLFTKSRLPSMPPHCQIISSSNTKQQAEPYLLTHTTVDVAGEAHFKYVWEYRFKPPLTRVGSHVEYSYFLDIPEGVSDAFTSTGDLFFVERSVLLLNVEATLIAPPLYQIRPITYWVEDAQGCKQELQEDEYPILESHGQVLRWRPPYREHHRFVCRYQLVPYGGRPID